MAKTFNGSIWGGVGDTVLRQDLLRRDRNEKTINRLAEAFKFMEKVNANRKLQNDWQDYFDNRGTGNGEPVDENMDDSSMYGNIFGIEEVPEEETSIWEPATKIHAEEIVPTEPNADFMDTFDPATANPDEIRMAQEIIGTKPDGIWGPKSMRALREWRDKKWQE